MLIVKTKMYRPKIPVDFVQLSRLQEAHDNFRSYSLTLVSSAAGYGKSTLIGSWLNELDCKSAWLSLEKSDDDLRLFLGYLIAAIQNLFPQKMTDSCSLLEAAKLPPMRIIVGTLLNELEELDEPLFMVLDDLHCIRKKSIMDLLCEVVTYPPQNFHLVILTRHDPFLPIAKLRAKGKLNEIRAEKLRFTLADTVSFLEKVLGTEIESEIVAGWWEQTEGWVTGLRLATLTLQNRESIPKEPYKLWQNRHHSMEYLLQEVLDYQQPEVINQLLSSAIADRFCAPLCDALQGSGSELSRKNMSGEAFCDWLEETNLFVMPLDEEHKWFRYHHLFQDLLREQAKRRYGNEAIAELHRRASEWFEREGFWEEAIEHALAAGNIEKARQLVEKNVDLAASKANIIKLEQKSDRESLGLIDFACLVNSQVTTYPKQKLIEPLTARELEILEFLEQGLYQKEIAQKLYISTETVKTHCKHIYHKLAVGDRRSAIKKGYALNLLVPGCQGNRYFSRQRRSQ